MPAKSKNQMKFLKAIAEGYVKAKGLSKPEAEEMTKGNVGKKKYSKLPKKIKEK